VFFSLDDAKFREFTHMPSSSTAAQRDATRSIRPNMPEPIPVMVLARLAVDARAQETKLEAALTKDALQRCLLVSQKTGVRAMFVHVLNDREQNRLAP
jgi:hypothetical protein